LIPETVQERNKCELCSRKTLRQCNAILSMSSGGKQRVQCVPNAESKEPFLRLKKAVTMSGCILVAGVANLLAQSALSLPCVDFNRFNS
jgi:hypothetical protein